MLTQTITAPAVPAAKIPAAKIPGAKAFPAPHAQAAPSRRPVQRDRGLRGCGCQRILLPQGRGNLRRRRALRICLSGDPRRGPHLQAPQRRTASDRRIPPARRRIRPRCRVDPSPDRRSNLRHHRSPGEAPQPGSRRRFERPGRPQPLDPDGQRPAARRRPHVASGPQDRDGKSRHFPAGNGPSPRPVPA